MDGSIYRYYQHNQEYHGFLAYDKKHKEPRPGVIIAHDWSGCNQFAQNKAIQLAKMGYVGFALDLYGLGQTGSTKEEKMALMDPLVHDRRLLQSRLLAAFDALIKIPEVDNHRIAAIGYCFGGLCVLDLARSGAAVKGVVSFHGLLGRPKELDSHDISAKILVLHGYDDPMVKSEQVIAFCDEMTASGVDWQVQMYGHTMHAFTNPEAHDPAFGTVYDAASDRRSWLAMTNFLHEIFV